MESKIVSANVSQKSKKEHLTLASLKTIRKIASSLSIFFATSGQFLDTCSDIRHGIMGSDFLPQSPRDFKISMEATFNWLHRKNKLDFEIFWILAQESRSSIYRQIYLAQLRNLTLDSMLSTSWQLTTNRIVISWRFFFTNQLFADAERIEFEESSR